MKKIPKPQTQIQEVLYALINFTYIDRRLMMNSFHVFNLPDQIFKLRKKHNLTIELTKTTTKNKFNREIKYGQYSLKQKKEASKTYLSMQEKHNQEIYEKNYS